MGAITKPKLEEKAGDIQNLQILISHPSIETKEERYIAHVLDHSLLEMAETPEKAVLKAVRQVKNHMQFNENRSWDSDNYGEEYNHYAFDRALPMQWSEGQEPKVRGFQLDIRDFSELEKQK